MAFSSDHEDAEFFKKMCDRFLPPDEDNQTTTRYIGEATVQACIDMANDLYYTERNNEEHVVEQFREFILQLFRNRSFRVRGGCCEGRNIDVEIEK